MSQFNYALTVAAAPLHVSTGAPIMELGREARVVISGETIDKVAKNPIDAHDYFMAMVMDGAEKLWEKEIKTQWVIQPKESVKQPSSNSAKG